MRHLAREPMARSVGPALLAAVVTACGPAPRTPEPKGTEAAASPSEDAAPAARAVQVARAQAGEPYRYGGDGPGAFDCSGLVHFAYERAGVELPRTVARQRRQSEPVDPGRLQPGDLLFFRFADKVAHVGMYLGDGRFIHAPKTGQRVERAELDRPFWRERLVEAGRPY